MFSSDLFFPSEEVYDWGDVAIGIDDDTAKYNGEGVTVAIFDTGVDQFHPDLSIQTGVNFVDDRSSTDFRDPYGHGTFVAGVIACLKNNSGLIGVSPAIRLIVARVGRFDEESQTFDNDLVASLQAAMLWALDNRADVINLSLEFDQITATELNALEFSFMSAAKNGVLLVGASGNGKKEEVSYPAASEFVFAVGALGDSTLGNIPNVRAWESTGRFYIPWFSNYGRGLDVIAPGVRIPSTIPVNGGSYAWGSGTSVAAPYVTALCALLLQADRRNRLRSDAYTRRIRDVIKNSAIPLSGVSEHYQGSGVVNARAALSLLGQ